MRRGHNDSTGTDELILEPARSLRGVEPLWLAAGRHVIGAGPKCTLRLTMSGVGETHCEIVVDERRAVVKALDPRTWLNHGPVKESQLRPGDRLVLGPIEFAIRRGTPAIAANRSDKAASGDVRSAGVTEEVANLLEELAEPPVRPAAVDAPQAAIEPVPTGESSAAATTGDAIDQEILGTLQTLSAELQEREEAFMQTNRVAREDLARVQNQTTIERAALREAEAAARARHAELEIRGRQLDARAAELADEVVRVEAKQRTLDEMLASLEQQRSQLGSQSSDMDRNLSQRQCRLAEAEQELQRRRQILDEAEEKLGNRYTCVHDEAESLQREKESLAAAMKAFDDARQARSVSIEESDSLRATLAAEREQLRAERESLARTRAEIDVERGKLECERREIESLRREQQQQRQVVEAFETGLVARERQILTAQQQLEAERERIQVERIELAAREDELEIHARALERKRQEIESLGASQRAAAEPARDQRAEQEALRAIEDARRELQQEQEALREEQARLQAGCEVLEAGRDALATERSALDAERSAIEGQWSAMQSQRSAEPAGFGIDTSLLDGEPTQDLGRGLVERPAFDSLETPKDTKSAAVRSALADMFGMSRNMLDSPATVDAEPEEAPRAIEPEPPRASAPAAPPSKKPELQLEDAQNPDSVAAYMEQLLARNRKPSSGPVESYAPRPVERPRQPSVIADLAAAQSDEQPAGETVEPAPAPAPRPRRPHDKDALRANLDTMREVANLSARKALESHARKRVKGMVVAKTLLAVSAFAVAAAIFGAPLLGFRVNAIYGWIVVAIGAFVLADMFRATLTQWSQMFVRHWREKSAAEKAALPRTGAVEPASEKPVPAPAELPAESADAE